jgi:ABC-type multidrug transport system permease subunit
VLGLRGGLTSRTGAVGAEQAGQHAGQYAVEWIGDGRLLVAFQFAATWIGMFLGLVIRNEEAAAQLSVLVLPLGMLSNVFVPTAGMPAWQRTIADWNPVSAVTAAVRELCGNPVAPTNGAGPLEHPVLASLLWTALLLALFVPLSVRPGTRGRATDRRRLGR